MSDGCCDAGGLQTAAHVLERDLKLERFPQRLWSDAGAVHGIWYWQGCFCQLQLHQPVQSLLDQVFAAGVYTAQREEVLLWHRAIGSGEQVYLVLACHVIVWHHAARLIPS